MSQKRKITEKDVEAKKPKTLVTWISDITQFEPSRLRLGAGFSGMAGSQFYEVRYLYKQDNASDVEERLKIKIKCNDMTMSEFGLTKNENEKYGKKDFPDMSLGIGVTSLSGEACSPTMAQFMEFVKKFEQGGFEMLSNKPELQFEDARAAKSKIVPFLTQPNHTKGLLAGKPDTKSPKFTFYSKMMVSDRKKKEILAADKNSPDYDDLIRKSVTSKYFETFLKNGEDAITPKTPFDKKMNSLLETRMEIRFLELTFRFFVGGMMKKWLVTHEKVYFEPRESGTEIEEGFVLDDGSDEKLKKESWLENIEEQIGNDDDSQ